MKTLLVLISMFIVMGCGSDDGVDFSNGPNVVVEPSTAVESPSADQTEVAPSESPSPSPEDEFKCNHSKKHNKCHELNK